jgi:hypothetical protein
LLNETRLQQDFESGESMKNKAIIIACLASLACSVCMGKTPVDSESPQVGANRSAYLDDLIQPHRYSAGKNSFILQHLARNEKQTLLSLDGSGSVRHIWTTWPVEDFEHMAGQVLLRVYVDGESQPAIEGSLRELFQAAEKSGAEVAPMPVFFYNRSLNLYLPIYFEKGIRIEAEPTVNLGELFVQIDYRQTLKPESSARLVSQKTPDGVRLEYAGSAPQPVQKAEATRLATKEITVQTGDKGIIIPGPAILRRLTFQGEDLDDLELLIYWDDESDPAVQAPLRYFFGGFTNAAVESEPGRLTAWFPMPFRKQARLVLRGAADRQAAVSYDVEEAAKLPDDVLYFNACFREKLATVGYRPYLALQTEGMGHFVGVNLFDTGHNHGGGDTASIDPCTDSPRIVHGINGEDYFAFAWHDTGRMNLLTGAPIHDRRYRLHLENPYPFHDSLRFTFGVFAGNHPKSVAFWYQAPGQPQPSDWNAVKAPWNVLGPLAAGAVLPEQVDERAYETEVPSHLPIRFAVRWQQAEMDRGFLDLTDHFRHFTMTRDGSGFLVGKSVMRLVTYIYSDVKQELAVRWGHDDPMTVSVNGKTVVELPGSEGFHSSPGVLPLEAGWNELTVTMENENNVDWRWNGLSFAIKKPAAVRFALKPK